MSRPQKIHQPLPFSFNQVLAAVGMRSDMKPGNRKPAPKPRKARADKKSK
jgi:hypothetical protein